MNKIVGDLIGENQKTIHTISPSQSMMHAIREMVSKGIGSLIVEKDGKHVGIITERDVMKCFAECDNVYDAIVEDAMTSNILYVSPDNTLEYAAHVMRTKGIRHLPVFEEEELLYVLSIRDIAFAKMDELQLDMSKLADHMFTWELNGQKHHFFKDIIGAKHLKQQHIKE